MLKFPSSEPAKSNLSAKSPDEPNGKYGGKYQIINEKTGKPLASMPFAFKKPNGTIEHGVTDENGYTHALPLTTDSVPIDIHGLNTHVFTSEHSKGETRKR